MKAVVMGVGLLMVVASLCCVYGQTNLVSNVFGNHMVLQRSPQSVYIWGWVQSTTGEIVSVYLDGERVAQVLSTSDRDWLAIIPPQPPGGPHVIDVVTVNSGSKRFTDVYFGDVWVCSGQSNMQMTVDLTFNASAEIADANNYPQIRVFTVGQGTTSATPLEELATITQSWQVGSSTSVGGPSWGYFSAVCWFAARDLYNHNKIPIGVISSNWGGTIIQAWMSPAALSKCSGLLNPNEQLLNSTLAQDIKDVKRMESTVLTSTHVSGPDPNSPSALYNAMIYPIRLYRIRGVLWYQGESNVGNAPYYACAQPAMIQDWSNMWNLNGNLFTFFFVQLSPWVSGPGTAIPDLRESQLAALALPNVGFTTAADLGDIDSPAGSIHPRNKQALGSRLALSARAISYGESGVIYQGPLATTFRIVTQEGTRVVVEVSFQLSTLGTGLVLKNAECPSQLIGSGQCGWYEIQRPDNRIWVNATSMSIHPDGTKILITADGWPFGQTVDGVRYAYATWPVCNLYNEQGLPAIPFSLTLRNRKQY